MWYTDREQMNICLKEWVTNPLFRIVKEVMLWQKQKTLFLKFPISWLRK